MGGALHIDAELALHVAAGIDDRRQVHDGVDAVPSEHVGQAERIRDVHGHRHHAGNVRFAQIAAEDDIDVGVIRQQSGDPAAEEARAARDQHPLHRAWPDRA